MRTSLTSYVRARFNYETHGTRRMYTLPRFLILPLSLFSRSLVLLFSRFLLILSLSPCSPVLLFSCSLGSFSSSPPLPVLPFSCSPVLSVPSHPLPLPVLPFSCSPVLSVLLILPPSPCSPVLLFSCSLGSFHPPSLSLFCRSLVLLFSRFLLILPPSPCSAV